MAAEGPCSSKAASLRPSQPPALRGLPEGKQPRRQISQGVLTEAPASAWKGRPGADFASQRIRSGTVHPPRLPLGLPQARSRSHGLAEREGCSWEKGTAAALLPAHQYKYSGLSRYRE